MERRSSGGACTGGQRGRRVVEVGQPIPVENSRYHDRDEFRDQTFDAVKGLRTRARQSLRVLGVETGGID